MNLKLLNRFFSLFSLLLVSADLRAYESLNQVIAIVGTHAITQSTFEKGAEKYKALSRFAPAARKKGSLHSQILDFFN
jgi:hypothetical protein